VKPVLSIIVAAYNAETTIKEVIDSVYSQDVDRILYELIIVNDGSKDKTEEILDSLVSFYPDMTLIIRHIPNGGVCNARNYGISIARGEYITFMDSDDYYGESILSYFFEKYHQYLRVDFWKYGAVEHYIEHGESLRDKVNDVVDFVSSDATEILRMALEMEYIPLFGYVWNGFYKQSIIEEHHIKFSSDYIMEDFMFSFEYLTYAKSMGTIPHIYYHYMLDLDKTSLSKKWEPKYYEMYRLKVQTIHQYMLDAGIEDVYCNQLLSVLYVKYMYSALERMGAVTSIVGKYQWLQQLWQDDVYKAMKPYMKSGFSIIGILSGLLKYKWNLGIIACTECISFVRHRLKGLFAKIKSN
jgi:glycosyltransferase